MPMQIHNQPNDTAPNATPVPGTLRVFLADDHAVVREGIKTLVNAQPDMRVVGEADSGEQGWRKIRALSEHESLPHVVVMDISMPGWNGTEATARVHRSWPDVKVLALSMHEDRAYLRALLEAGAAGYVLKRSASGELIRAIRVVAGGGTYLDPTLMATVVDSFVKAKPGDSPSSLRGEIAGTALSEREDSVLRLIAQGHTNKEIAAQLKLSVKTVETYKSRSMEKLGLDNRADIVRHALTKGWLV